MSFIRILVVGEVPRGSAEAWRPEQVGAEAGVWARTGEEEAGQRSAGSLVGLGLSLAGYVAQVTPRLQGWSSSHQNPGGTQPGPCGLPLGCLASAAPP